MKPKLMLVVRVDWNLISHRLPIALEALRRGYEVHIAAGITDKKNLLESYGMIVHPLPLNMIGSSLLSELKAFLSIIFLLYRVRPDILHLVTIRPVLYGGVAARLVGIRAVVAAISGLGSAFLAKGLVARVRSLVIVILYRLAMGAKNIKVIFQNPDDKQRILALSGVRETHTIMIPGSGVDLSHYASTPLPEGVPLVVMAARLLRDKGVYEFIEAARILKKKGISARFCLVGKPDPQNPTSVKQEELTSWTASGEVEIWGHREDIAQVFSAASIVVLPSYREGLPKVLIEAAACGRPVVTTDVPGCRDAIVPGVTGLLVPPRDAVALADAIAALLADKARCTAMGKEGRSRAEKIFDIAQVVDTHLRIYEDLLR